MAYTAQKGAPIQQVRESIMSLTHIHHADFHVRSGQKLTKPWLLRLMMVCKRGPAVGWSYNLLSSAHRVRLELACKTLRLEVFHLFAPRPFFCKSVVRPGRQSCVGCYFKNIEALCVHASCWWTVLRVVCSSAHHVCPGFVLVISR